MAEEKNKGGRPAKRVNGERACIYFDLEVIRALRAEAEKSGRSLSEVASKVMKGDEKLNWEPFLHRANG